MQPTPPPDDADRFRAVLTLLATVEPPLLRCRNFLVALLRAAGVHRFGPTDEFASPHGTILQDPHQLADALLVLSGYRIRSVVEVGTFVGRTACFTTAYLLRFNADLQTTCVDPVQRPRDSFGLPIRFLVGTSDDLRGRPFDLAFIDGDHSYAWVERDYANVGVQAPLCLLHDIDNADSGIPDPGKFWAHLKAVEPQHEFFEFTYPGRHFMGLGLRVGLAALRHSTSG